MGDFMEFEDQIAKARAALMGITMENLRGGTDGEVQNEPQHQNVQGFHANVFKEDDLAPEIADILSAKYDKAIVPEEYKCFKKISATGKPVKYELRDDEYIGQTGISICELNTQSIINLGREVIPMLQGGFTTQGAGCLFILAYNLKTTDGSFLTPVYSGIELLSTENDVLITDLSSELRQPTFQHYDLVTPDCEPVVEAAYYCYLAACTLRLYTKSANNFLNAWEHIQTYFHRLYNRNAPMSLLPPKDQSIKDLATFYHADPKAKQTLYRLLYLGARSIGTEGLRLFCVEMHLTHTGLHLIPMFIALCSLLNCDPGILLAQFAVNEFSRQCRCVYSVLMMMQSEEDHFSRGIWKYGRIFDDTFLSDIQTKQCPKLVCLFASALQAEASDKYQSVMNITHIASMPQTEKNRCAAVARCIISNIRKEHSGVDLFLPIQRI